MCLGGGSAPAAPAAPTPPAEVKQPESIAATRVKRTAQATGAMGSGTLLTGPGGVTPGSLSVAKPSLLGM